MQAAYSRSAVRLTDRDRVAFAFRLVGAGSGLILIAWTLMSTAWPRAWAIAVLFGVVVGGAVAYHVLTSVVRCPTCRSRVVNFRIGPVAATRKLFRCAKCGGTAYLTEGFYWQRDWSG